MKLVINTSSLTAKGLHLNISDFAIDITDLTNSEVINITTHDLGKYTIDIFSNEQKVEQNSELKPIVNDIAEVKHPAPTDLLFDRLVEIRREIAREEKLPPYFIFHDSSLKVMAVNMPVDLDSMRTVPGVGKTKLEKYGAIFIEAIREYLADSA